MTSDDERIGDGHADDFARHNFRLRDGKATIATPDPRGSIRLLRDLLGLSIIREEHDAVSFDADHRLRVTQGDEGTVHLYTTNDLEALRQQVRETGFVAELNADQDALQIEMGYFAEIVVHHENKKSG